MRIQCLLDIGWNVTADASHLCSKFYSEIIFGDFSLILFQSCFIFIFRLIDSCDDMNKKKIKIILEGAEKELTASKSSGAKVLLKKLEEIK